MAIHMKNVVYKFHFKLMFVNSHVVKFHTKNYFGRGKQMIQLLDP